MKKIKLKKSNFNDFLKLEFLSVYKIDNFDKLKFFLKIF